MAAMPASQTPDSPRTLAELGEDAILDRLTRAFGPSAGTGGALMLGIGDDAAVLRADSGQLVITTDTLTEDQDFRPGWFSTPESYGESVGHQAVAQNLSDIVAMGAHPTAVLLSLVLPPELDADWVDGFGAGVAAALSAAGADLRVAGGDLGAGPSVSVSVTALGEAPGSLLRRDSAQPTDVLAVGPSSSDGAARSPLGSAAAGLALLEAGMLASEVQRPYLAAQLYPSIDVSAGVRALAAGAHAGLDVSDGLLRDTVRLASASGVVIDVESEALRAMVTELEPLAVALGAQDAEAARAQAWGWLLSGGEDYVLLASFPAEAELPRGFTRLGTVHGATAEAAGTVLLDGADPAAVLKGTGWDSLR